jgi:hypothetical protein
VGIFRELCRNYQRLGNDNSHVLDTFVVARIPRWRMIVHT